MKKPVQIFPTTMSTYSSFSRERAKYFIGRPDWAISEWAKIGENEAREIVTNLPEELLEVVKEHYGLVTAVGNLSTTEIVSQINESTEGQTIDTKIVLDGSLEQDLPFMDIEEANEVDIYSMNMTQLRKVASELEIKGYTKYDKAELIAEIEKVTAEDNE